MIVQVKYTLFKAFWDIVFKTLSHFGDNEMRIKLLLIYLFP